MSNNPAFPFSLPRQQLIMSAAAPRSSSDMYTIFGATGIQGGAVAVAIAREQGFKATIRAITLNPESAKSRALAQSILPTGAALILCEHDLSTQTADSGRDAVRGSDYIFLNSDSFSLGEQETERLKELVDAAAQEQPSLRLLVWSTLPCARSLSGG